MKYQQIIDRKNVLVAGGAGFIGSHLCDTLVKNRNVICVDSFITGQEENIDLLLQNPHFKFIKHDLTERLDPDTFPELEVFKVRFQGVQEIYNLACPTSPKQYNHLPIETLLANSDGTRNLLDLAERYGARFLHGSSSAIYGDSPSEAPVKEDYWGFIDPIGPRSCYNEGKRFAESLVVNYGTHRQVNWRIARIFNTFGPRMKLHDGRMIPDMVNHALTGRPLTVYGSPDELSTFCYVTDMVDGLVKLMEYEAGGLFNLGATEPMKLGDIARSILKLSGATVDVAVKPSPGFLGKQGVPHMAKATEQLGWFPLVPMEEGLRQTIDYFRAHQNLLGLGPTA